MNQLQPTGFGFVLGSQVEHGISSANFFELPVRSGLPPGHGKSFSGSLVNAPPERMPLFFDQQFPCPPSSHQKSTPLGARRPSGLIPIRLPMYLFSCEVS